MAEIPVDPRPHPYNPTTRLNQAVIDQICLAVEKGSCFKYAAEGARVGYRSARKWLHLGEQSDALEIDDIYAHFYRSVKEAEARLEAKLANRWRAAVMDEPDGWKGCEAFLAKRFRDEWGKNTVDTNVNLTGDIRKSPEFRQIINLITAMVPEDKQIELSEQLAGILETGDQAPVENKENPESQE